MPRTRGIRCENRPHAPFQPCGGLSNQVTVKYRREPYYAQRGTYLFSLLCCTHATQVALCFMNLDLCNTTSFALHRRNSSLGSSYRDKLGEDHHTRVNGFRRATGKSRGSAAITRMSNSHPCWLLLPETSETSASSRAPRGCPRPHAGAPARTSSFWHSMRTPSPPHPQGLSHPPE